MNNRPIQRIFLMLVVLAIGIFLLYGWKSWQDARTAAFAELRHIDRLVAQTTRTALTQHEASLRLLGEELLRAGTLDRPDYGQAIIERFARVDRGMAGYGLARPDGQLVLVSGIPLGVPLLNLAENAETRASFEESLRSEHLTLGRPYAMPQLQRWVIPLRVPLRDADGRIKAVMASGLHIDGGGMPWNQPSVPNYISVSLIRSDGYIQFQYPVRTTYEEVYGKPRATDLLPQLQHLGYAGSLDAPDPLSGSPDLITFTALPEYGIYSLASSPQEEVLGRWMEDMSIPLLMLFALLITSMIVQRSMLKSQQAYEERLLYQAKHDTLTGLPNRSLVIDRLRQSIDEAMHLRRKVAVMFLDLDNFKNVNDRFGHDFGDELLREVARRLATCVAPGDTIARVGGDEFLIILPAIPTYSVAEKVASRVLQSLRDPIQLRSRSIRITTSIGIATAPDDGDKPAEILRKADLALYQIKDLGRNNYGFFTEALNQAVKRRLSIEEELRRALERNEFELHYQPQVDTSTGHVLGFEALLRWDNANLGGISPEEFIPIAEDMGLISAIDDFVLHTACHAAHALEKSLDGKPIRISVNISAREILEPAITERVRQTLEESGLPPQALVLEITETAVVSDFVRAATHIADLRKLGVNVSIDDFGTGYSSLAYLSRLRVTEIKVDRSFVRDMLIDEHDRALTHSIISMGKALGLYVVAEGVETNEQREQLQRFGCDVTQGYLISRPLPYEQLAGFLAGMTHGSPPPA